MLFWNRTKCAIRSAVLWDRGSSFRPACLRTVPLPTHPSPATPPPRPASGECGHPRHPSHHNHPLSLSLSLSDRRLWRAWENHPGWLHTPSEPLNHLRNQDRTFASTSWSTAHLSSQSPARDLRPPPHRPSSRTQLGWGSGTCDPFILLDAVPRDLCSLQTKS